MSRLRRVTLSPRGLALAYFVVVGALAILWAVATPMMGVPDEPDHVRRAAGIVRGQLFGVATVERLEPAHVPTCPRCERDARPVDLVRIPESLGVLGACTFGDFPPECPALRARGSGDVAIEVESRLSRYNPVYYALVGIPTLVEPGRSSVYVMRALSALLAAGALALAALALLHLSAPRWAIVGLAVAVTPMVLFFAGSVNPNGIEIAAGVGLWATLLAWLRDAGAVERNRSWAARASVLAAAVALPRGIGPAFLVLIVAGAVLSGPPGGARAVWSRASTRIAAGCTIAVAAAAVAWTKLAGTLTFDAVRHPEYENLRRYLFDVVTALGGYQRQMIGVFGWLDTPVQEHVYTIWLAALGLLLFGAIAIGPRRMRLLLALLVLSVVAVPIVVQLPAAPEIGLIWQGRYLLPLVVGLPLAAGVALAESSSWRAAVSSPWAVWSVLGAIGAAQLTSFWWALHRNVIGLSEAWIGFDPLWQPPLGWIPLTALYALCVIAYVVVLAAMADSRPDPVSVRDA